MHSSPRRPRTSVRFAALALAASAAAVVLTGCGAGQITQTATQIAAVNGESGAVGGLRVSNAVLEYPEGAGYWAEGSDVSLRMAISNNGGKDDQLQLVSTAVSAEPRITGDKAIVARRTLTVGTAPAGSTGEADAAADAGDVGKATIVLTDIKQNLYPGMVVRMTLTFRNAGPLELRMPIAAPQHPRVDEPHEGGGEH
jgi:copper(I)-binding protein